jgi:ribosome-binding factor A
MIFMSSRRVLKVAEAIREVVALAILTEIRDPRVQDVTVTFVEVSSDLRQAKVHVSVMGDEKKQHLCLHGLNSSAGFLQQKINQRVETRYTPKLRFELDKGIKNAFAVTKILDEVLPSQETQEAVSDMPTDEDSPADDPSSVDAS